MSDERIFGYGILRRDRPQYTLCSPQADVEGIRIAEVPESLAAQQTHILGLYSAFQNALATLYESAPNRQGDAENG